MKHRSEYSTTWLKFVDLAIESTAVKIIGRTKPTVNSTPNIAQKRYLASALAILLNFSSCTPVSSCSLPSECDDVLLPYDSYKANLLPMQYVQVVRIYTRSVASVPRRLIWSTNKWQPKHLSVNTLTCVQILSFLTDGNTLKLLIKINMLD